jgi:DnaK suppressor protein
MNIAPEPTATVEPLSGSQRLALNDLLTTSWRDEVTQIIELATAFHAADDSDGNDIARRLAVVRRRVVDIETALQRIQSRTYGRCDGCERRIPFEHLELRPEVRFCTTCQHRR